TSDRIQSSRSNRRRQESATMRLSVLASFVVVAAAVAYGCSSGGQGNPAQQIPGAFGSGSNPPSNPNDPGSNPNQPGHNPQHPPGNPQQPPYNPNDPGHGSSGGNGQGGSAGSHAGTSSDGGFG